MERHNNMNLQSQLNIARTLGRNNVRSKGNIAQEILSEEEYAFQKDLAETTKFMNSDRFANQKRPYGPAEVCRLRPTVRRTYAGTAPGAKLSKMIKTMAAKKEFSHTFGCLDPVQVIQMAPHLSTIYVSGWQSSSTASTTNEPGPDLADYPYTTVPNKVDQLYRAQEFHDRKQAEERSWMTREERANTPRMDYYRPIIADGDTGHGGLTAVMRLTKLFIQAGAGGIHFEDQKPGTKKCGHMAGKVLVSMREHCDRLIGARLQADIMGAETVLVARTDSEAATLLDSNVDPRDHPFILGATNKSVLGLNESLKKASEEGADNKALARIMGSWEKTANLKTYGQTVAEAISASNKSDKVQLLAKWNAECSKLSHDDARALAKSMGFTPFWCWNMPRTREGYFRIQGGVEYCIARAIAFGPYADLIWMETKKPGLKLATYFTQSVRKVNPWQLFAYNLSPSFNWDAAGMTDPQIKSLQHDLAKLGVVWQFITLAGFHSNALITTNFARAYAKDNMLAYVNMIQRQERDQKVSTLTHQKWSGAEYMDTLMKTITGGLTSTASMSHGNTEAQFAFKRSTRKPTEEEFSQVLD